jgi:hypothetical protein
MLIFPLTPSPDMAGEGCSHASRSGVFSLADLTILASLTIPAGAAQKWAKTARSRNYRNAKIQWINRQGCWVLSVSRKSSMS